jgi:hypothetical protein
MKKFITLTLVLFLSFSYVGQSKSAIPDATLRCEVIWTEPIDDPYWNSLRFTSFYEIISSSGAANYYFARVSQSRGPYWQKQILGVTESTDLRYLYFDEFKLDRETLILDVGLSTMSQCSILSDKRTIDEYLETHKTLMQIYIQGQRNKQLKKNKL